MGKKILVCKKWHQEALAVMTEREDTLLKQSAFLDGLESFLHTKLTPEQQKTLQKEINQWVDIYETREENNGI